MQGMSEKVNTQPWSSVTWVVIVVGAVPAAWLIASIGFKFEVASPWRDIAVLLAWSISEEIVFRGGVQPLAARALERWAPERVSRQSFARHISWANLLTSLIFCAAHVGQKSVPVVLALLPISLLLGASLEHSQRLWVPVALHAYFNLLLYAASILRVA